MGRGLSWYDLQYHITSGQSQDCFQQNRKHHKTFKKKREERFLVYVSWGNPFVTLLLLVRGKMKLFKIPWVRLLYYIIGDKNKCPVPYYRSKHSTEPWKRHVLERIWFFSPLIQRWGLIKNLSCPVCYCCSHSGNRKAAWERQQESVILNHCWSPGQLFYLDSSCFSAPKSDGTSLLGRTRTRAHTHTHN